MDEKTVFSDGTHTISNEEYHASAGISRSALMQFKRSPYHYQQRYLVEQTVEEDTAALRIGNLIHTAVLEPHRFADEYIVAPKFDRRTNAGKFAHSQFQSTLAGRIAVSEDEEAMAYAMASVVHGNDLAAALLDDCVIEESIYFTHKSTGLQCKVRPDAWNGSIVIDLKTTKDACYPAFQRSAFQYGYFLQAGMIYEALRSVDIVMEKFVFLAIEKKAPYPMAIYTLDDEAIDYGVNQFNSLMEQFANCHEKNKWPGYPLMNLCVPNYANFDVIETVEIEE
jgi:hypothetical protein